MLCGAVCFSSSVSQVPYSTYCTVRAVLYALKAEESRAGEGRRGEGRD